MKINKKCSYCDKSYDYYLEKCPHCNEPNKDEEVIRNRHITMVAFWKQIIYFFVGWLGFQGLAFIMSLIVSLIFKNNGNTDQLLFSAIVNFVSYGILFIALCLITWKDYTKIFISFYTKKWKPYVFAIVGVVAIFAFSYIYNFFLMLIGYQPDVNENETGVRSIVSAYPLLSILIFGFVGPFCEEMTYRVGLFSFFRRIHISLAYAISIVVFALIHFSFESIGTDSFINELANLPNYLFSGAVFAFLYHKLGLASSLTAHVTNNLISLLFTLIRSNMPQ